MKPFNLDTVWFAGALACATLFSAFVCRAQVPQAASTGFEIRAVVPSETDPAIDQFSGDGWAHVVYRNPAPARKNQLMVFLAGTNGKGNGAKAFNSTAASEGFDVVSLAYPSTISISTLHASDDPDAFYKARENVIYGAAPYETLKVSKANCIMNRLIKLLVYLDKKYPNENWKQYLTPDGQLQWSQCVLAGQSQGGGHAALLAIEHKVARVIMFGSPKDFNVHFNKPAVWYSMPSKTPIDRYFSFVHSADDHNGCTYPQQLENYKALGPDAQVCGDQRGRHQAAI